MADLLPQRHLRPPAAPGRGHRHTLRSSSFPPPAILSSLASNSLSSQVPLTGVPIDIVGKLPGDRIHDLRHSAVVFMMNAGTDLYAAGRVLGHADHKSTMRYSRLSNLTGLVALKAGAAGLNSAQT